MTESTARAKPATIYDVAVKAGVSKSTVSLVIRGASNVSPEKKAAVEAAIGELGYRPSRFAQQLASHKTRSIGVVITDYKNLSYLGFLKGLREILDDAGYQVIVSDLHRSPNFAEDPVDAFISMKVDGLVLATEPAGLRTHNLDIPCVMIGKRETLVDGADIVFNDDSFGTRLALEHLKAFGHTNVAHLTGLGGIALNRREAFIQLAKELGLAGYVFGQGQPTTEIGGYMGAKELLASGRQVSAVYCANDYMAAGAISALQEAGVRVPEDLSVIGYDNAPIASDYLLKLTTIDEQGVAVGRQVAALLLERITSKSNYKPKSILIEPTLVTRTSVAAPQRVK
ncbi:MAG: hypothetical protein RIS82_910 [Actinomycetota bacterium]